VRLPWPRSKGRHRGLVVERVAGESVAGYRGLRFGELAGLRPRRVNLFVGRLEVAEALKEMAGHHYFGLPKHERVRTVSLPPFLVEVLPRHI